VIIACVAVGSEAIGRMSEITEVWDPTLFERDNPSHSTHLQHFHLPVRAPLHPIAEEEEKEKENPTSSHHAHPRIHPVIPLSLSHIPKDQPDQHEKDLKTIRRLEEELEKLKISTTHHHRPKKPDEEENEKLKETIKELQAQNHPSSNRSNFKGLFRGFTYFEHQDFKDFYNELHRHPDMDEAEEHKLRKMLSHNAENLETAESNQNMTEKIFRAIHLKEKIRGLRVELRDAKKRVGQWKGKIKTQPGTIQAKIIKYERELNKSEFRQIRYSLQLD
jgi:hypothetical protein